MSIRRVSRALMGRATDRDDGIRVGFLAGLNEEATPMRGVAVFAVCQSATEPEGVKTPLPFNHITSHRWTRTRRRPNH